MFFGAFFAALFYARNIAMPWMGDVESKLLWPNFQAVWPNDGPAGLVEKFTTMGPWPIPTIIIVTSKFFKKPKKKKLSLAELSRIHDSICQYCLKKFKIADLTIDHIKPKSKGGTDEHENRTLACLKCNQKKSDHSPFLNIKNEVVTAPVIPNVFLHVSKIRKEWESFI
jgi:hypothetical protein